MSKNENYDKTVYDLINSVLNQINILQRSYEELKEDQKNYQDITINKYYNCPINYGDHGYARGENEKELDKQ